MNRVVSKLVNLEMNSALMRRILRYFYKEGKSYRIPFGPLHGLRMYYDHSINFHAMLGLWELANFQLLSKVLLKASMLKDGMVFCDVGADIGSYSLWFSQCLPKRLEVYAFEPSPSIVGILRRNLLLNNAVNVTVEESACSDTTGSKDFFVGHHHHQSSLCAGLVGEGHAFQKQIKVKTTTLDDFFYGEVKRTGPDLIKMDIEGGGVFALKGCKKCIDENRPMFLIESHNPDEDSAISYILTHHDYRAFRINNGEWVKVLGETFPNPKGVWGSLFLCPAELQKKMAMFLH